MKLPIGIPLAYSIPRFWRHDGESTTNFLCSKSCNRHTGGLLVDESRCPSRKAWRS
jgi:hypothetical protein